MQTRSLLTPHGKCSKNNSPQLLPQAAQTLSALGIHGLTSNSPTAHDEQDTQTLLFEAVHERPKNSLSLHDAQSKQIRSLVGVHGCASN